eukprot:scaffold147659_cov19-Tisochrysis_lutea.AAC.1
MKKYVLLGCGSLYCRFLGTVLRYKDCSGCHEHLRQANKLKSAYGFSRCLPRDHVHGLITSMRVKDAEVALSGFTRYSHACPRLT